MICENLQQLREKISTIAQRCGRDPRDIELLAVSKQMSAEQIRKAYHCGQLLFGENFVQEAMAKIPQLDPSIHWHFIGHLQSNKARQAVRLFAMVETVDRVKLAEQLNKHASACGRILDILVQVNVGEEQQKSGIAPQNVEQFLTEVGTLQHLRVRGLMTIPPYAENPEQSRPFFRALKQLADHCRVRGLFADNTSVVLSMGMSGDYPVAIEEGATLLRIGTAIFGERPR
ncbi:MAG TPA: YggS family pyridoxal phosphate-dependent enzyme [Desulfobulbaceae bacterium]|nr:YggS family pyridoxal phosphate-dependent enzyme [Desulfobulbaceae bacterium]